MFCPNCGTRIEDGALFCPECGTRVADTPVNNPTFSAPAAAPAKKGFSKGAKIGIAAAAVAVIAAVVVLILVLGGSKNKLVGTWKADTGMEDYGIEFRITFKKNGEFELERSYSGSSDTMKGKYTVDKDKTLTLDFDGSKETFEYNKEEAMDMDDDSWYLDGNTLYLGGMEFHKG